MKDLFGFEEVAPASPVAPYIGGKRNLAARITARIDSIEHSLYGEPFVGMAGIFLRRRHRPDTEVINDISGDVITLFRILQRHYVPFMDMLRYQLTSRAEFERLSRVDPTTLTDLERAARFLYLQRTTFGGKVAGRNFGVTRSGPARFDVTKLQPVLEEVHERLAGVVIEQLPWSDFLTRYDRAGALFYLDPPYWASENDYGKGVFGRGDFQALAEQLSRIKGRFILSINDVEEVRQVFARFRIEAVNTTYTLAGGRRSKEVGELIVSA